MKMIFFLLILVTIFIACATPQAPNPLDKPYQILSAAVAASHVIKDEKEGFFEQVVPLEMSIQMKTDLTGQTREEVLPKYQKMLQEDLLDFSPNETQVLTHVFEEALDMCAAIQKEMPLPSIQLIKTKGRYYASGVYYTRDNCIIIPAPILPQDTTENYSRFLSTLLHEIFHIYSRYNTDKREALYARLGFERLAQLELSTFLKNRVLYNPDGVDLRYAITLQDSKKRSFKAIPVIYSKFKDYQPEITSFFSYLMFQLFEVEEENGTWRVVQKDVGHSLEKITGFWEQVTRNTAYNIHPDELCADNFVLLAKSKKDPTVLDALSEEGQQLVKDFEEIMLK